MLNNPVNVLKTWVAEVNAGKVESVVALYADDAVMLPTFSPRVLRTPEQRRDYFTRLGSQKGLSVYLHENTLTTQPLSAGGDLASVSGIYRFSMEIDGAMLGFEARFTYVVDTTAERPILHHHSSQIPRNLS